MSYDEFIRQVDAGNVKSATLDHLSGIRGTYLVDGEERPFLSYSQVGSASDPLLIRELERRNVSIEIAGDEPNRDVWKRPLPVMMVMWGVPLATLLVVIRISRRLARMEKARQDPAG